jgi:hypothetical protein
MMGLFDGNKKLKQKIQALEEAQRDILNSLIVNTVGSSQTSQIRKNNYQTYPAQINIMYRMYNSSTDYGSGLLRNIIDTRSSLIAGEGLSIFAKNKKTQKFIDTFIKKNNLNGSRLFEIVTGCEMEGKSLVILIPDSKDQYVKTRWFSFYLNNYTIETDKKDSDIITSIHWTDKAGNKHETRPDRAVYMKTGGTTDRYNDTPPRTANVLTQIENYERALYDLRFNNHLFGRITPYWKTENSQDAKVINNALNNKEWDFGKGYAGAADFKYVSPDSGASDTIAKEMSLNLKIISAVTGIPVHWLGWTDLMSNRSTADELREMLLLCVKKEKLIIVEKIKEMIQKAMEMSVAAGFDDAVYDPDGFVVDLPVLTMDQIKSLVEVWIPLMDADLVSHADVQNRIPGINPSETNKMIESEKAERMMNFAGNMDNIRRADDTGEDESEQTRVT